MTADPPPTDQQIRNIIANVITMSFDSERFGSTAIANDVFAALAERGLLALAAEQSIKGANQ